MNRSKAFCKRCKWCVLFLFNLLVVGATAQQLVLPGDHPDPSVVKIGDTYWASATSSNWMPAYPLLKSTDLVNWKTVGHIFPALPAWADYYFWAPEMTYENGKVYVYYTAHKKGGNLCVAVASADKPEGPYKDHGPLMCEEVGSIDAFPMRDEKGKLYLIWKEDGNSVNKPTPIWIQEMNEERTALVGEKKELFRNDAPWEGALVEGVSMMKQGDYYYAFYAAAGCCGSGCTYNSGVARAKKLEGPWEKFRDNPILKNEGDWTCPGHGTPVMKDGRFYFLYHAYHKNGSIYSGRQGLLREFRFTPDGWIAFAAEAETGTTIAYKREDEFKGSKLALQWEWSVFQTSRKKLANGKLELSALPTGAGAFVGQKAVSANYDAETEISRSSSTAAAGLALIGDEKNVVAALLKGATVQIVQVKDGKEMVLSSHPASGGKKGFLKMQVRNGKDIRFFYGSNSGNAKALHGQPVDGSYLPPWDRALRIGLVSKGKAKEKAVFEEFEIEENK